MLILSQTTPSLVTKQTKGIVFLEELPMKHSIQLSQLRRYLGKPHTIEFSFTEACSIERIFHYAGM